ncbi:MAG: septation protein SepH [Ornithinibacter sp.]
MQDLRLIGVHEDGHHLLLADADGGRYRLTLDEALRAAARRDRPRLGQLQIEIEGGLRPREVQALIRRGLSAEEVADRAGWTVDKVRRFEGPVLAEREHVAQVAQKCAVGSQGSGPVTLAERVAERLRDRGVDRDDVEWDSARDDEGVWQLSLTFAAGGRQRTATWRYEPLGGSVAATNDEARWLSEEAAPDAIPTPHRAGQNGDSGVYDIDADGGVEPAVQQRAPQEPIDLMAAMREHSTRGRRRRRPSPSSTPGDDRPRADALPIEDLATDVSDAPPPPAARGRNPASAHLEEPVDGPDADELVGGWPDHDDDTAEPPAPVVAATEGADDADQPDDAAPPRSAPARKGRPSVPSWDDIVFGTRGGGSG